MSPIYWLVFDGPPVRQFYSDPAALPYLDPKKAAHMLLDDIGILRQAIEGENVNVKIALRNEAFEISRAFSIRPPFGQMVRLYVRTTETVEIFAGVLQDMDLDANLCSMTLEA